MGNSMT